MDLGTIFNIERLSFVDGPGIRTTVFFKGCNLSCAWCHNPESQHFGKEMLFYRDKCTNCGTCKTVCPNHLEYCEFCGQCVVYCPNHARTICGKEVSVKEVLEEVKKDTVFYNSSDGGVTFSGGECMLQIDFLVALLQECREYHIHTAVDTAGNVPWEYFEKILPYTDLFLYDIKCMDSKKHQTYTGVDNKRILENLAKLLKKNVDIWVRIPIIPSVNDTPAHMCQIRDFLREHGRPKKIELLPYHPMGLGKYQALDRDFSTFQVPDKESIVKLFAIVQSA